MHRHLQILFTLFLNGVTTTATYAAQPQAEMNADTMGKPELVAHIVSRAALPNSVTRAVCDPQQAQAAPYADRLAFTLSLVGESDLRQLIKSDIRVCLDQRMTRPTTWDFLSKTVWGAYYVHKDFGKVLALADDGQPPPTTFMSGLATNNRTESAETISRLISRNVISSTEGTVSFATLQSTVGRISGSRDMRNYVQWGQEPGRQMQDKGLFAPPILKP